MSTASCLFCGAANSAGTRACSKCGAKILAPAFAPQSRLNLSDEQDFGGLPSTRYESELMLRLSWDAHDFLEGNLEEIVVEESLIATEEAFGAFEGSLQELQDWTNRHAQANPDDSRPGQALFYGLRGAELFREGLELAFQSLEQRNDDELSRAVTMILDGNDRVAHCFVLMQANDQYPN